MMEDHGLVHPETTLLKFFDDSGTFKLPKLSRNECAY